MKINNLYPSGDTKIKEKLNNDIFVLEHNGFSFLYNKTENKIISECFSLLTDFEGEEKTATFEIAVPYMSKNPTNSLWGVINEYGELVDYVIEFNEKNIFSATKSENETILYNDGLKCWSLKDLIEDVEQKEMIKHHNNASYREKLKEMHIKGYLR